jgi:RNA 3'-terminal phosphate cyclase
MRRCNPTAWSATNVTLTGGNSLILEVQSEYVTEIFAGVGRRGVPAELVAEEALSEMRDYLATDFPVAYHLADYCTNDLAVT